MGSWSVDGVRLGIWVSLYSITRWIAREQSRMPVSPGEARVGPFEANLSPEEARQAPEKAGLRPGEARVPP
jgi:hypothetical protein